MKDDGGPAFPCKGFQRVFTDAACEEAGLPIASAFADVEFTGMTLRDYFAAKALQLVIKQADNQSIHGWAAWTERVAATAYEIADAMVAERMKR